MTHCLHSIIKFKCHWLTVTYKLNDEVRALIKGIYNGEGGWQSCVMTFMNIIYFIKYQRTDASWFAIILYFYVILFKSADKFLLSTFPNSNLRTLLNTYFSEFYQPILGLHLANFEVINYLNAYQLLHHKSKIICFSCLNNIGRCLQQLGQSTSTLQD